MLGLTAYLVLSPKLASWIRSIVALPRSFW